MEMKVVNVDFVENEMVELDVVQIGLNWGWIEVESGDGYDCDGNGCGDKCGDDDAEKIKLAGIPFNTKLTSLYPLPNQSKPIVPLFVHSRSFSFIIIISYILIIISYIFIIISYIIIIISYISITFSYTFITISYNL